MLNFRKLRQDFASSIAKEGRELHEDKMVVSAKVMSLTVDSIRISGQVRGKYDNTYECELEIDRNESELTDSNCDCPYDYDCQHLASLLFYLESEMDRILVDYSAETDLDATYQDLDEEEKKEIIKTVKIAETKHKKDQGKKFKKEMLEEYGKATTVFSRCPFFLPVESFIEDQAKLSIIFTPPKGRGNLAHQHDFGIQLALRLPHRNKPLVIPDLKEFIAGVRYYESLTIGGRRYLFTFSSFDGESSQLFRMLIDFMRFSFNKADRKNKVAHIEADAFGMIVARAYELYMERPAHERIGNTLPCLFMESLETPVALSSELARLCFELGYLDSSTPKISFRPKILLGKEQWVFPRNAILFECAKPGVLFENTYHRFQPKIKRAHLRNLPVLRDLIVPEPLFGTLAENALPELARFAQIEGKHVIDQFVTLPYIDPLKATCYVEYLDGELEASLYFQYGEIEIPATGKNLSFTQVQQFKKEEGILARNLVEEQHLIDVLFQNFVYDPAQGTFFVKSEKKIVEFMTGVIPELQDKVKFVCPDNLLEQFIYDETTFTIKAKDTDTINAYELEVKVKGYLKGVKTDRLWDCLSSKRNYLELEKKKGGKQGAKGQKILVIDLEQTALLVSVLDELGISCIEDQKIERPLWSLSTLRAEQFENLPFKFSISPRLKNIQKQLLGETKLDPSEVPKAIQADVRNYQVEGVHWLDRLRKMHLNGILADDMGLGKTLQAIIAMAQAKLDNKKAISLVVCPTSLVYNWQEEFHKFNPKMAVIVVDGTPTQRKKTIAKLKKFDVAITSYSLLQKDIGLYETYPFTYAILDEGQHIKNRTTQNAKSVKQIQSEHKLVLTGTPIENSLDELWSLFDFLMPGFLSTYDRFVSKYVRHAIYQHKSQMAMLREKVAPFILRRMKEDVLDDLPPVSEMVYHCHLSPTQLDLYRAYAASAKEELSQLVQKQGFEKVQIHILATLTRLKQICCHPALFAKESAEQGDSAKYDLMIELLQTLVEGRHKTVIFSQYTKMLKIMRGDFEKMGITFSYLDGSTKNRLEVVKEFNADEQISVFLVSLKAGGTGLNLVGADTVIHYDQWYNPAVRDQALDRVHRIGQNKPVSSISLVTLGTIEEKIVELQEKKRALVEQVINCDDEAISKLTWKDVLELLEA